MEKPTRERLLDAAERLLSILPMDEVSVRDITVAAKTNIASVNYHFGSKQALIMEVVHRRMQLYSAQRESTLVELESRSEPPSVREIVLGFMAPVLTLITQDPRGGQRYVTMLARLSASDDDPYDGRIGRESTGRYLALYRRAMPDVPPDEAAARLAISWATILNLLGRPLNDGLPTRQLLNLETPDLVDHVLDFVVSGLSAGS